MRFAKRIVVAIGSTVRTSIYFFIEVLEAANLVAAHFTPRSPDLEIVHPLDVLEEFFLTHVPTSRNRREESITTARFETVGTIVTGNNFQQVFLTEVVSNPSCIALEVLRRKGRRVTGVGLGILVVQSQHSEVVITEIAIPGQ